MFTVYVLFSVTYNKIYIGSTGNLEQRLLAHNQLAHKGWTIRYRPWEVVYTEIFDNKKEALAREKQLKTAKGRAFIWELIGKRFE